MKRMSRIAASTVAAMLVLAIALASPVAGSAPRTADLARTFEASEFFPMAVGNAWQWTDAGRSGTEKHLRIVDRMVVAGHTVWVAETESVVEGQRQAPGTLYFVEHERGLFATRYLDTLMDWSHDTDRIGMLQRWTDSDLKLGTHTFQSGAAAQAYTLALDSGALSLRIHDSNDEVTYQRYVKGIGPVARGTFELERATVAGKEYML